MAGSSSAMTVEDMAASLGAAAIAYQLMTVIIGAFIAIMILYIVLNFL